MRPRTLAILVVVVGVLAAFIWFVERDLPSSEVRAERAKRVVLLEEDEVERLSIEWDGRVVELAREEVGWQLVRPLVARADAAAVDGLVTRLVELEKEREMEDVRREDVGLAEPRGRVTLTTGEGDTVLEIGAEIPASSNMTLAVDGEATVFVVRDAIWQTLTQEPGDWRDKRLFDGERGDIERLVLHSDDRSIELAKRGDAFWIEVPLVDLADEVAVSSLLATVSGLRAESFVDQVSDAAALGLDPAAGILEVGLAGSGRRLRLEVGGPVEGGAPGETTAVPTSSPSRYLRLDGQIVTSTAALTEHLERTPSQWRSLDWVASRPFEVDRIVVSDEQGELELRREDGDWLRDGVRIVQGPASDLLYEITDARATGFFEADPDSLGAARVSLVLESGDGASETAWLYPVGEGGTAARVFGREVVLLLGPETAAELAAAVAAVRDAETDEASSEDA